MYLRDEIYVCLFVSLVFFTILRLICGQVYKGGPEKGPAIDVGEPVR